MELCIIKIIKLHSFSFLIIIRSGHFELLRLDYGTCFELGERVIIASRTNVPILWLVLCFTASIEPVLVFINVRIRTAMTVVSWVI